MPGPRLIVHLVHGTWGRGVAPVVREELGRPPGDHPAYWFESGSTFRAELTRLLPDLPFEFREFVWSGSNSFRARSGAAKALHAHLRTELQQEDARHLLIGHSHAGNVIFETLTGPDRLAEEGRIAGVLTLATPYLAVETDPGPFNVVLHRLLPVILGGYALGLVVLCALWEQASIAGWLAGSVVAYAAGIARLRPASPWRWPRELLFWAAALFSAGCVGLAVLPWVAASSYPAASFYAILARGLAPPAAAILALANLALLVAARAAGATPPGTFLLRDLVNALAAALAGIVLVVASAGMLFFSHSALAAWYGAWLVIWPVAALFVDHLATGGEPRASLLELWRAKDKEAERGILPCELHAMRMAGDEATLAIVASQLVRAVAASPRKVLDWMAAWSERAAILLGVALLVGGAAIGYVQAGEVASGWLQLVVGVVIGAGEILLLLTVAAGLLMATLLLLATLSYGLVGLAVGADVLALLPTVSVACESLPRGTSEQMKLTLLWPDPAEREHLPLRHSMYDLPSVQARVARWMRQAHRRT